MISLCDICGQETESPMAYPANTDENSFEICVDCFIKIDEEEQRAVREAAEIIHTIYEHLHHALAKTSEFRSEGAEDIYNMHSEVYLAYGNMPAYPELYTRDSWERRVDGWESGVQAGRPIWEIIDTMLENLKAYPAWYLIESILKEEVDTLAKLSKFLQ